jgi:hypothetical protein
MHLCGLRYQVLTNRHGFVSLQADAPSISSKKELVMAPQNKLDRKFNHWRKRVDKVNESAPRTVKQARAGKKGEAFHAADCQADPCNCTGCSTWD